MSNIIPVVCDDPSPAARAANVAALAMQQTGPDNRLAVNGPNRQVYLPLNAMFEIPGHLAGEGHTFIGEGHIAKITSGSGTSGRRVLENLGFENETILDESQQDVGVGGSHITFDSQQDLNGLILDRITHGKGWRHLDQQRLNQTAVGGALRRVSIRDCEFTGATYASRMFRHVIGYEENIGCRTHHNEAGMWVSSGSNALSVARMNICGEFTDNQRYGFYVGGDTGTGLIDGITFKAGMLFERNSLLYLTTGNPVYRFGDLIIEATTARTIRGVSFEDGACMGESTPGQLNRIDLSPQNGAHIAPVNIGNMVQIGPVPLWTQINGKVKVYRRDLPIRQERTDIIGGSATIFRFVDRNGNVLNQAYSCSLHITVSEIANGANSCIYEVKLMGNANGMLDRQYAMVSRRQRGVDVGCSVEPFGINADGPYGAICLTYARNLNLSPVRVCVEMVGVYNG